MVIGWVRSRDKARTLSPKVMQNCVPCFTHIHCVDPTVLKYKLSQKT